MDIRIITKEERLESNKIAAVAYQYGYDCKISEAEEYPLADADHYGAFDDDGKMMARLMVYRHKIYFDGQTVESGGIANVATLPEYRHKKAIRRIFELAYEDMKADKLVFSQLYPFSYAYYNKFGYETFYEKLTLKFPMRLLDERSDLPRNNRCKLIEDNKNPALRRMYENYASCHNGALQRCDRLWKVKLSENIYEKKWYPYIYCNENNEPSGYFLFTRDNGFKILELCWDTPEDIKGILGFIKNFAADYDQVCIEGIPKDEDFSLMFKNQYLVERTAAFTGMGRVVDVQRAFELMRYPEGQGSFSVFVDDEFQPCNSGVYRIRYQDGKAADIDRNQSGGPGAELDVSAAVLTKLLFGTEHLLSRRYQYLDGLKINRNAEILKSVFVKKKTYMGDFF